MSEQGKEWTPPQLTVLTRGKNEENVLTTCKTSTPPEGPATHDDVCNNYLGFPCHDQCQSISTS